MKIYNGYEIIQEVGLQMKNRKIKVEKRSSRKF